MYHNAYHTTIWSLSLHLWLFLTACPKIDSVACVPTELGHSLLRYGSLSHSQLACATRCSSHYSKSNRTPFGFDSIGWAMRHETLNASLLFSDFQSGLIKVRYHYTYRSLPFLMQSSLFDMPIACCCESPFPPDPQQAALPKKAPRFVIHLYMKWNWVQRE